ncbi:DUF302 domain-containing protein [Parvularcula marina]|uniref:DUF302 domain-containing protein n=1 Tax=Parvularcula marina TaxID=2292771 RepID=UPI0035124426
MRLMICALSALVLAGCGKTPVAEAESSETVSAPVLIQDRFRVYESAQSHSVTLERLLQSLDRRDLTVFSLIDHRAGAQSIDQELPPSTLVIFGNPKGGTPLMQAEPLMGIELPMRALVYEQEGKVMLALTGTDFLEREYDLTSKESIFKRMEQTLETIANEATAP